MTARMLVDLGLFDSCAEKNRMFVANRRLNKLARKATSRVRRVGAASIYDCLQVVFCTRFIPQSLVQHEIEVSLLMFGFDCNHYQRTNVPFHGDALIIIGDDHFILENERKTNNAHDIRKRSVELSQGDYTILWVCKDEADMKRKIRWTAAAHANSLYTTFDRAVKDPHAMIWQFADGLLSDLPRAHQPVNA